MKKFALAVSILAASAVSASAADLAARPYTKAPPPVAVAMYDWSGFYIGANGGYGTSRKCWDNIILLGCQLYRPFQKDVMMRPEERQVARSATVGRALLGCLV